jgi:hypothetical protein
MKALKNMVAVTAILAAALGSASVATASVGPQPAAAAARPAPLAA